MLTLSCGSLIITHCCGILATHVGLILEIETEPDARVRFAVFMCTRFYKYPFCPSARRGHVADSPLPSAPGLSQEITKEGRKKWWTSFCCFARPLPPSHPLTGPAASRSHLSSAPSLASRSSLLTDCTQSRSSSRSACGILILSGFLRTLLQSTVPPSPRFDWPLSPR